MDCEVCQEALPRQDGRGRPRQYHEPCKAFRDGLALLRFGVANLPRLSPAAAGQLAAEVLLVRNSIVAYINTAARKKYGKRLRTRRQALGMSQSDLASAAGVTPCQISRYELGQREASRDVAGALDFALWAFSQSKKKA